jgi:transcriptional regulator with XRE-family HTH domain
MKSQFGARLREHRERQGIALATVAARTKIKESLLAGLERGNLSHWPNGLFRRAYVRSYAQAIGLEPDVVVRELLEVFPEPPEEFPAASRPAGLRGLVESALDTFSRRSREETRLPQAPPEAALPQAAPEPRLPDATIAATEPAADVELDLMAAARVCTDLGRSVSTTEIEPLLREAARILNARGLVLWLWDEMSSELRPVLAHGYSRRILKQLAGVRADADNLTAAAFRAAETRVLAGSSEGSGALAVPLLTPSACAGVLALELPHGKAEAPDVRAVATFLAAMLAQLFGSPPAATGAACAFRS